MGLNIIIKGADFSANNLGNVNPVTQFINKYSITDDSQKSALYDMYNRLVEADLWQKITGIFPLVGGTADKHKGSLKGGFELTYLGTGTTHSSTGITFDGNGTADTGYSFPYQPSMHISAYNPTALSQSVSGVMLGAGSGSSTVYQSQMIGRYFGTSNQRTIGTLGNLVGYPSAPAKGIGVETDATGLLLVSRLDATNGAKLYDKGTFVIQGNGAQGASATPLRTLHIGGYNGATGIVNRQVGTISFVSFGLGLTDDEVTSFTAIINDFQLEIR